MSNEAIIVDACKTRKEKKKKKKKKKLKSGLTPTPSTQFALY
jgi:hypothetical protein